MMARGVKIVHKWLTVWVKKFVNFYAWPWNGTD